MAHAIMADLEQAAGVRRHSISGYLPRAMGRLLAVDGEGATKPAIFAGGVVRRRPAVAGDDQIS
jgi:hypothetical protein